MRRFMDKILASLLVAGILALFGMSYMVVRHDERLRILEENRDYFHGEAGPR